MKNDEFYTSLIGEIFDGYSESNINESPIYIKHLNIRDQRYLQLYHEKYRQRAIDKGVETLDERTKRVIEDGMWTDAEDLQIESLKFEIENLKKTIKGIFLPSQQDAVRETLNERRGRLGDLLTKKQEILGATADDYATSRSSDELLRFLLFKSSDLKENLYTEEEFANLETWQIIKVNKTQESMAERLSDTNIQEAVLRPSFAMYLSLCERVGDFYGKPIVELSVYQLRVVLYGKMFFNIFQNTQNIPDNIKENPQKLMAFAENQQNTDSKKSHMREDADGTAIFGATKDDMETLDLDGSQNVSLREEAAKHGGKLDMKQMMRLAGHDV